MEECYMNINFKEIDDNNWEQCIFLTTNKDGKHIICEEFVASNALSIAQAKIQGAWNIKAIYDEDKMVGFTMYGYCYEHEFYEVCRLMIDYRYQGKGYGKAALTKVIEGMKTYRDCSEIFLSFDPKNQIGKRLYESLGFRNTGRIIADELLYSLKI